LVLNINKVVIAQFNRCTLHKNWSSSSWTNYWLPSRTRHELSKMDSFGY